MIVSDALATGAAPRLDPGLRVLVVEDNVDAARLLALLLRARACHVSVAHDGTTALQKAHAERPHVMLVDIGLPDVSGYELARRVRADGALSSVHLIALTGYDEPRARELAAACGFDHHLAKPVERTELEALLATCGPPERRTAFSTPLDG